MSDEIAGRADYERGMRGQPGAAQWAALDADTQADVGRHRGSPAEGCRS